jgi:predicted nucleotidyltransferase
MFMGIPKKTIPSDLEQGLIPHNAALKTRVTTEGGRSKKDTTCFYRHYDRIGREKRERLLEELSFLSTRSHEIHSIVLIGSMAYDIQEEGSDIDIAIICKDNGFDSFREFLFDKELEGHGRSRSGRRFEFTVLDEANAERYFRMASPFAYAMRCGAILKDDGYFRRLMGRDYPIFPGRVYCVSALYENISVQYYGAIDKIEKDIKQNKCSYDCCSERKSCNGRCQAEVLAKTIMRMLYVTLSSRGYVPLSKKDVMEYANEVYGENVSEPLHMVIDIMRRDLKNIYYSDYKQLKLLAVHLFGELLSTVGLKPDVLRILKNAVRLIRGDYSEIDDSALNKCVA